MLRSADVAKLFSYPLTDHRFVEIDKRELEKGGIYDIFSLKNYQT